MSKLSILSICCIFATLSLLVSCGPTSSSSSSSSSSLSISSSINKNKNDEEIHGKIRRRRATTPVCLRPAKALLYPYKEFQTRSLKVKMYDSERHGNCMALPESWVESINTQDSCARIYIASDCTGAHVVLEPGTDHHRDVKKLFVSPLHEEGVLPGSIGNCK